MAHNRPMSGLGKLLVYRYTYWDEDAQCRATSTIYATFEAIRNGLGTPLYPTALEIDRSELRQGGLYVPTAPIKREVPEPAAADVAVERLPDQE